MTFRFLVAATAVCITIASLVVKQEGSLKVAPFELTERVEVNRWR